MITHTPLRGAFLFAIVMLRPELVAAEGKVTPLGYVEAYYAWNFAKPSNTITNYRGFDNRHDSFSITNAALGVAWEQGPVSGKVLMQVGSTPSTYYLAEPTLAGTPAANATGPELWKFLQEANAGYKAPIGRGVLFQAGIFLSPIGPEVMPVKDNWNWSRSNLFFGLPFYHTGVQATYELDDAWALSAAVYNGWNSVVDNNIEKSVSAHVVYKVGSTLFAQLLYFGGDERPTGSPEGRPWRSDFDAYVRWEAKDWLSLLVELNTGFEHGNFGTSSWYAGALYARVRALSWLYFAARGDFFHEHVPSNASGSASPIFWAGANWVSEATVTVEIQPAPELALFVEYRHDQAASPLYFRGTVTGLGTSLSPFIPNSESQDTLSLAATTWF